MNKKLLFLVAIGLFFSSGVFAANPKVKNAWFGTKKAPKGLSKTPANKDFPPPTTEKTKEGLDQKARLKKLSDESHERVRLKKLSFSTTEKTPSVRPVKKEPTRLPSVSCIRKVVTMKSSVIMPPSVHAQAPGTITLDKKSGFSWADALKNGGEYSLDESDGEEDTTPRVSPEAPHTIVYVNNMALQRGDTDDEDELTDYEEDGDFPLLNPAVDPVEGPQLPPAGSVEALEIQIKALEDSDVIRTSGTVKKIVALNAKKLHVQTREKADELRDQSEERALEYQTKIKAAKNKPAMATRAFITEQQKKGTTTKEAMLSSVPISTAKLPGHFEGAVATINKLVLSSSQSAPEEVAVKDEAIRDAASPEGDLVKVEKTHRMRKSEIQSRKTAAAEETSKYIAAQHTTRTGKSSHSHDALMGYLSTVLEGKGDNILAYVKNLPHEILFGETRHDEPVAVIMDAKNNVQKEHTLEKDGRVRPAFPVTNIALKLAVAQRALTHKQRSEAKDDEGVIVKRPQTLAEALSALMGTKVEEEKASALFTVMRDNAKSGLYYKLDEIGSNVSDKYKLESAHDCLVGIRTKTKEVRDALNASKDPRAGTFAESRKRFVQDLNQFEHDNNLHSSQGAGTRLAGALKSLKLW